MVLKLCKKCIYTILCWYQQEILVYWSNLNIYVWKVSFCTLRKWYCAMTYCFRNIRVWSRRILLKFHWVSFFFDILIPNILWTVAQTSINHIIFWKSVIRTFRCIYENCFNRIRFLTKVSTKLQKMHFLNNLRTITQEGNMKTRQMTQFFSSTFCNIHSCIWK